MSEAFRYLVSVQPGIHGEATGHYADLLNSPYLILYCSFIFHVNQLGPGHQPLDGDSSANIAGVNPPPAAGPGAACSRSNVIFIFSDFFNFPFHLP